MKSQKKKTKQTNKKKTHDSEFYNFPDIGLLNGKLHHAQYLSLVIPQESLLPSQ